MIFHNVGLAAPAWGPDSAGLAAPEQGIAWENRLPPDLKRGAPDIYRSLRSSGSSSVRDWLNLNYKGYRKGTEFMDLWNIAVAIDFRLGRCKSTQEETHALATDDWLDLHLRRSASFIYEARRKDAVGARQVLALQAPGAEQDIAPSFDFPPYGLRCTHPSKALIFRYICSTAPTPLRLRFSTILAALHSPL